jgi:acetyl esterase/lipase
MPAAQQIETRPGLTYATHDGVALLGDLYVPAGGGPFPALIAAHGGGWQAGGRTSFQFWGPYLAARGYVLFAISYRLAKKGQKMFPQAVHDVLAAVQFVRGSAGEIKVDPERIGLFGASAGAHLVALAALGTGSEIFKNAHPNDAHAAVSTKVKALIGVYGVYDLVEMWQRYQLQSPRENNIENFMGCAPMDDPRRYFDASPINYATFANNHIGVFLSVATEDDLVNRRSQTDAFLLRLKQANFFVRPCIVQGAPHYWLNDPIEPAAIPASWRRASSGSCRSGCEAGFHREPAVATL